MDCLSGVSCTKPKQAHRKWQHILWYAADIQSTHSNSHHYKCKSPILLRKRLLAAIDTFLFSCDYVIIYYISFIPRNALYPLFHLLPIPPAEPNQKTNTRHHANGIRHLMIKLKAFRRYENIRGANHRHPHRWHKRHHTSILILARPRASRSQPMRHCP